MLQNKLMDAIVFDNVTDTVTTFIEVSGNQLFLSIDAYDADSAAYERIE